MMQTHPVSDSTATGTTTAFVGGRMLAAMSIPQYPRLWATGMLLNLTRWTAIFLCTYLVNDLTHSTVLVQLVGAALFAPLFLGGVLAGAIADRLDRKRTLLALICVLLPASVLMAVLELSGALRTWMVYPFTLAVGTGLLADMTMRRAMVYDIVPPANLTNALALEALAMQGGAAAGSLGAGAVISVFGIGEAFLVITVVYAAAFVSLAGVTSPRRVRIAAEAPHLLADVLAAFRALPSQPALISVLGVTIIVNLFYFSFMPLIPVFGDRLEVGAFLTSLLLSANAIGSIAGSMLIARGLPLGRGVTYIGGSTAALCGLFVFAVADWYPLALLALLAAGTGIAGFATMQSLLTMVIARDEMRGRAMGLLSMSIGVLPISMVLLGLAAQAAGPVAGVVISVLTGMCVLAAWCVKRPEALQAP
jgi:predicted MFS family arabinose efflux permease